MNILDKLLRKRGIKDVDELDAEERGQFDEWRKALLKDKVDSEDIKSFCEQQISVIESKFRDIKQSETEFSRLALQHSIYKSFIHLIESPKEEKERLIKYLEGLLED